MLPRLFLLSLILFCLELGVFLLVLPWTSLWERNYFVLRYLELKPFLLNHYVRGGVSGLGLVDLGLGFWYATHFREIVNRLLEAAPEAPASSPEKSLRRGQTA